MKSIAIVTNRKSSVAAFLRNNLEMIFKGFVKINSYYIDHLESDSIIEEDIVLFMIKEKALECEKHVLNKENIMVIERTLNGGENYKIFTLPKDTKVLVVNDTKETTMDTVSLLYNIGINDLQLIPYEQGKIYEEIKIAITPDEEEYVPKHIETIINVGNRCIDISTFIKIINKLDINNKKISKALIKYSESIINLNDGIKESYKELFVKKEELDIVINLFKEGVLFIDNDYNIIFYNRAFKDMFYLKEDVKSKNLDSILDKEVLEVFRKDSIKNEVIKINGKYISIDKHIAKSLGENIGFYFNTQEVTYIKQLEQNLSQKLRNSGMVTKYNFDSIKTNSPKMQECINLAKRLADSDLTVLITGESGTGKELMAQSIHNASSRAKRPFVAINCAALPENLLESELFGYEAGAFTGALREGKIGLFEQANNGTIFLDEIGDMPLSLQARILRVLQERQVMRIGSQSIIDINVRIVSATNRSLIEMIQEGKFREDLFYRLNVLPINIPSLRDRKEDILLIINSLIRKSLRFSEEVKNLLLNYNWPGNIRELQNVASYIELMSDDEVVIANLPYYMLHRKVDFEREFTVIERKCSAVAAIEIMRIIEDRNLLNMGVGRKNIEEIIKGRGKVITEAEIRRILSVLNEVSLVTSNVGRKGSELTLKGKDFINWLKNRME